MKTVIKYKTGDDIPNDAIYLCTKSVYIRAEKKMRPTHYFLVENKDK